MGKYKYKKQEGEKKHGQLMNKKRWQTFSKNDTALLQHSREAVELMKKNGKKTSIHTHPVFVRVKNFLYP